MPSGRVLAMYLSLSVVRVLLDVGSTRATLLTRIDRVGQYSWSISGSRCIALRKVSKVHKRDDEVRRTMAPLLMIIIE